MKFLTKKIHLKKIHQYFYHFTHLYCRHFFSVCNLRQQTSGRVFEQGNYAYAKIMTVDLQLSTQTA